MDKNEDQQLEEQMIAMADTTDTQISKGAPRSSASKCCNYRDACLGGDYGYGWSIVLLLFFGVAFLITGFLIRIRDDRFFIIGLIIGIIGSVLCISVLFIITCCLKRK